MKAIRPSGPRIGFKPPKNVVNLETIADGVHPLHHKGARGFVDYTSPDEKKIEFTIEERDGVFVIFSRAYPILKSGHGSAINYVAEKPTREEAEELIQRLERL